MPPQRLTRHVLFVEDEEGFAETLAYCLTELAAPPWAVTVRGTLAAALAWLHAYTPTLVILDLNLPDSREVQTFERMWEACGETPIIVVTALKGTHLEGNIVAGGAVWYLDKVYVAAHIEAFLEQLDAFAVRPGVSG